MNHKAKKTENLSRFILIDHQLRWNNLFGFRKKAANDNKKYILRWTHTSHMYVCPFVCDVSETKTDSNFYYYKYLFFLYHVSFKSILSVIFLQLRSLIQFFREQEQI